MEKKDIVDEFIDFADYIKEVIESNDKIEFNSILKIKNRWEQLYKKQLIQWEFNKKATNDLFEWGENGHNWSKLHTTDEEDKKSCINWLDDFSYELDYCCDRMSLDRLFRCHWLYNQAIYKYKQDNPPIYKYNGIKFTGSNPFKSDKENIATQRLLCKNCAKDYNSKDENELILIKDEYWKSCTCSTCEKEQASYFMEFKDIKNVKRIR